MEEANKTPQEETDSKNNAVNLRGFLDGSILTRESVIKQLPFILFLTILAIIYIANRLHAEKIVRISAKLQREIQELRDESVAINSEIMYLSNRTEIVKSVQEKEMGLKEPTRPPRKIVVSVEK